MTERLYQTDSYLRTFTATVVAVVGYKSKGQINKRLHIALDV